MFYIYILYSPSADKYYVGQTDDVSRRLIEHNELSADSYTSRNRPWRLKTKFEVGMDRGLVIKVEKHIKKQKSRAYIKSILKRGTISKIIEKYSVG